MTAGAVVTAADLLAAARALLSRAGREDDPTVGVWPRAVAVLARQALELSLASFWQRKGLEMARVSARAQLLSLDAYLGDPEAAAEARFAWWALSRACHHHPYELAATAAELEGWLSSVEVLVGAIDSGGVAAALKVQPVANERRKMSAAPGREP